VSPSSVPAKTETVSVAEEGCSATGAVAAESAALEPAALEAVTRTRSVEPWSAEMSA
jgi:hypothetical protein